MIEKKPICFEEKKQHCENIWKKNNSSEASLKVEKCRYLFKKGKTGKSGFYF
jgi:hypothetical protein